MYRIIGADGNYYGPVSVDQMREWFAQRRVNGQTMAQLEGSTEWKPLSQYAEFASFVPAPLAVPPQIQDIDLRKSKLVAGIFGILLGGLGIHRFYLGYIGIGVAQIVVTLVTCGIGHLWGMVEGILILVGSTITTDAEGRPLKEQ